MRLAEIVIGKKAFEVLDRNVGIDGHWRSILTSAGS
jgi:hypothetical protein